MAKRVLDVETGAEIRRFRRAEGMPISEIAQVMEVARNVVEATLTAGGHRRVPGVR